MEGLFPIISMPFDKKGNIDLEDLEAEVEYGISKGIDGIGVAFGSEINKLTIEKLQSFEFSRHFDLANFSINIFFKFF